MAGRHAGGRNAGGRGYIRLTPAELKALINERVEEELAAQEATRNQNPLNQGFVGCGISRTYMLLLLMAESRTLCCATLAEPLSS
ncbi:hypothetical protein E3N88_09082 [Mikania micrantha]|uniref:Uncharacterized protein n=1 Tax=Mikania micrantha TaxID=192012 RepID=A0A5N6PKC3_9ASTR|nr:hypothetical protein E3N88_09082 [Mikania micrantha]